jgi:hypothetical protein
VGYNFFIVTLERMCYRFYYPEENIVIQLNLTVKKIEPRVTTTIVTINQLSLSFNCTWEIMFLSFKLMVISTSNKHYNKLCFIKIFPHIDVFWRLFCPPPFEASNSENMPYLDPKHCFSFEKCCLKSNHFFGAEIHQNGTSWGRQKWDMPRKFWTCDRLKMASGRS